MAPFGPFAGDRRVAVAVSGGADSMALALLLVGWGRPLALVVDHGLRAESAAEAALTLQRLAGLGIPARLLQAGLRPGPAAAERARQARYALLTQACLEAGCADLLVAHHARDQAETAWLRRAAGSGPAGQAGMAGVTYLEAVRVLRPLLRVQPGRLRALLTAAGLGWVEDPGNTDPATPRGQFRAGPLAATDSAQHLVLEAARHGAARGAAEAGVAAELAGAVSLFPEGFAHVGADAGANLSPAALSSLVWMLSGSRYPPPGAAVARLAAGLRPGTLHGVRIAPAGRMGPGWLIGREAAAMAPPAPAAEGWDGRFHLLTSAPPGMLTPAPPGTLVPAPPGTTLGALGDDAARLRRLSPLPSFLLRTLPTLRNGGAIVAVPHLDHPDAATCRGVPILFCPARPAAPAPFIAA